MGSSLCHFGSFLSQLGLCSSMVLMVILQPRATSYAAQNVNFSESPLQWSSPLIFSWLFPGDLWVFAGDIPNLSLPFIWLVWSAHDLFLFAWVFVLWGYITLSIFYQPEWVLSSHPLMLSTGFPSRYILLCLPLFASCLSGLVLPWPDA